MTRFLRFFPQRRPSVLQRLFISLYQTIDFIRLYEQNNKNELLVARCSSGFLLFLKMTQVSSCGFETLLRHYFLFIYIYILSLFCASFHCSYFFFVLFQLTLSAWTFLLIRSKSLFEFEEFMKKKLITDYYSYLKSLKYTSFPWYHNVFFFIESARGSLIAPNESTAPKL